MGEPRVQLQHPQKKQMPTIERAKYDTVRAAMLASLEGKELTHTELFAALEQELSGKFAGDVSWYGEGVKLDLEAKRIIERTDSKPQRYRLKN